MRKQKQPASEKKKKAAPEQRETDPVAVETPSQPRTSPDSGENEGKNSTDSPEASESSSKNEKTPEFAKTLVEENEQLRDRLLRLQADFDNFRKRQLRERAETIKRATEELMQELLPVCDHLEMAMESAEQQKHPIAEGVKLVFEQLRRVLESASLKGVEAEGVEFDPSVHEAVAHIASVDVPENHIIQQTRRGYLLGDKLLRPAQVVVSSGVPDSGEAPGESGGQGVDNPAKQEE